MQFHDYHTHYNVIRHRDRNEPSVQKGAAEFYRQYLSVIQATYDAGGPAIADFDPFTPILLSWQRDWHEAGRPYFNLWPSIIPALSKLKMDADSSFFKLPLDQLLIRFPVADNPLTWVDDNGKQWGVRAVLAENTRLHPSETTKRAVVFFRGDEPPGCRRGIAYWIDIGEVVDADPKKPDDVAGQVHSLLYKHVVCEEGKSIEWSFDNIPQHASTDMGVRYPNQIVTDVARLICTLCLMAEDKELVEPIVLRADEDKFDRTGDMGLVEKAKRRGNYGFNVGRGIEVTPHVRAASPAALYWVGKGRKIPKIRFRRGTVVHRRKLASVPTGYLDKEQPNDSGD